MDRLRREPGLALVGLAVLAAIALYAPTLGRGLVNYDEPWLLRDNWIVQHPSWSSLRAMFFELDAQHRFSLAPEYLPVRDLSVMLDFSIWGSWWQGFHLTNLVLYATAIVVWFAALDGFGVDRTVAGLCVLLWAVHPSHAESVAWLAERKGLLGVVFAGVSALGYARWRAGRRAWWLGLATFAAVCAVWSKALAAFAIAGLGGLELALPARRVSWRRSLFGLVTIGTAGALAFVPVVILGTSSGVVATTTHAPAGRLAMVLGVHGFYLRLGGLAIASAVSYPISTVGPSPFDMVLGAIGLVAITGVALVPARGRWRPPPALRAAAALWLFGWLPVSHLILPPQMVMVADRYALIPTLGLTLAAAVGLARIPRRPAQIALIAVVVLASSLRALDAQSTWQSPRELWARAVDSNPDDGNAWSMYAEALADAGDHELADAAVDAGLARAPVPRLWLRKGLLAMSRGEVAEATAWFRRAADAGDEKAMANLALVLERDGKLDDALAWAERAARTAPMYAHAQRTLGKIALALHRDAVALAAFERAAELEPTRLANRYNRALALIAMHRAADALPDLEACVDDPELGGDARAALVEARRQLDR
jgi:hypothetical protein